MPSKLLPSHVNGIVAVSQNGCIGQDGGLPWRLSSDLQRFKRLTMGHPIIMGRNTFESLPFVLPGRPHIIITRERDYRASLPNPTDEQVYAIDDIHKALQLSAQLDPNRCFIIGGATCYKLCAEFIDTWHITHVLADIDGDTYLNLNLSDFKQVLEEHLPAGEKDQFPTRYAVYERNDTRKPR